jgi:hypothetical protein
LSSGDKFALPDDSHAGLAADAGEVVAEGGFDLGEPGRVGGGLKKFTPAETSPQTSWRLSWKRKVVPLDTRVA